MLNIIKNLLFGNSNLDFLELESTPNDQSSFSTREQKAMWDTALDGTTEQAITGRHVSLSGKQLPHDWPVILSDDEVQTRYDALYDEEDDRSQPPSKAHIERLSYDLQNGDKRLRYFAVFHQRNMMGPDDPNMVQYDVLEKRFRESPPQLVLYEGFIDDVNHPLSRDQSINLGEPAFMAYLIQQHNAKLNNGEQPVLIESADQNVNRLPNEQRDPSIIKNLVEKFGQFDKIDIVMGSGHSIREKDALMQFFGDDDQKNTESKIEEIKKELTEV